MFRLRVSTADLRRLRFGCSPLAEVAASLHRISGGPTSDLYRAWFETIRGSLGRVDMPLLRALVLPGVDTARFLFAPDAGTTIERQLQLLAEYPADWLARDLRELWHGTGLPPVADRLLSDGLGRLVDTLWEYWQAAISPYWPRIRGLYEADVAYRAGRLADGGIEGLLADLHPRVKLHDHALEVGNTSQVIEHDLSGAGLLLVPCAFAGQCLEVGFGDPWPPHLVYCARGIGNLWHDQAQVASARPDVLGELCGRSRAAILITAALPVTTTDLARQLSLGPPTVSAHLSVLRRSGLLTSWRSGRRVLYQRTALASSIIAAADANSGTEASGLLGNTSAQ